MFSKRLLLTLGALLLTGLLATGAALAAGGEAGRGAWKGARPELSPGAEALRAEIHTLAKGRMEALKAEIDALVDKAAAEGKVTAEEAQWLKTGPKGPGQPGQGPRGYGPGRGAEGLEGKKGPGFKGGHMGGPMGGPRGQGKFAPHLTEEQVKAQLDELVKAGRLTQEQADLMLKQWVEMKARFKAPESKS